MPEVETFLREAWAAAERARIAKEAAADGARIAKEVEDLQRRVSIENVEIASGWRFTGIAVAIEAGILVVGQVCASAANNLIGKSGCAGLLLGLVGAVGALGAIAFGIAFWIGLVVVAVVVLRQLANLITRQSKIARLEDEIRSLQARRR